MIISINKLTELLDKEHRDKATKGVPPGRLLLFSPSSEKESERIQLLLFSLGVGWLPGGVYQERVGKKPMFTNRNHLTVYVRIQGPHQIGYCDDTHRLHDDHLDTGITGAYPERVVVNIPKEEI